MNDCEYLSLVQQKALSIVTKLLKELDEVESLYINREKMGSVHNVYVTKFFKRRVCALILWQKITHGLADNLSRLSNRLGTDILLPDVCKDPPPSHSTPGISYPTSPSSSAKTVVFEVSNPLASVPHTQPISANSFLHQIHDEAGISSESGLASPSPLSPSFLASFNVGSPVGEKFDLSESRHSTSDTTEQAMSSSSKYFDSSILQRRTVHQMSVLEPYKEFVSGDLKRTGIYKTLKRLKEFMKSVLTIAKYAMGSPLEEDQLYLNEEDCGDQKPLHKFMNPELIKRLNDQTHEIPSNLLDRSTSIDAQDWIQEFNSMELPPFTMQYIQLVHVPLDVIQECLKLQSEPIKKLQDHSSHNEKQLADECREILEHAIDVQEFYRENMGVVVQSQPEKVEQVEEDMEAFGVDMKNVLKVYLQYLKKWVSLSSGHILEEEWRKVKTICTSIRGGEAEAGKKFCGMVTQLLSYMGDDLDVKIDDCYSKVIDLEPKDLLMMSCREFKKLFVDVRKHVNRVLCFAKILIKDLEIAADFEISTSLPEFFSVLKSSDHVRVIISHQRLDKMIFVPESITDSKSDIQQLLNVGFAHDRSQESNNPHLEDSYILLLNVDMMDSQSSWTGKTIEITATAETIINLLELQVDSLKMVVSNSSQLTDCRNSFMRAVNRSVTLCNERTSSHENVAERILDLKMAACELAKRFMETPSKVMEYLNIDDTTTAGYHINSYRNTMHTCFNLGFEYVREVFRLLGDDMAYRELGEPALEYIITWIKQFVLSKCESGRGTQPRWASVGLEFMVVACAPTTLASISQNKFESVRNLMNSCVDHVIGEAPTTTSLLATHGALEQTSFSSNPITPSYATPTSYSGSFVRSASSTARSYYFQSSTQSSSSLSTGTYSPTAPYSNSRNPTTSNGAAIDRIDIIRQKIQKKEEERQLKLIELNQIGKVMDKTLSSDKETKLKKLRLTNFEWKLGRKLGQGSFSTVYECLNLTTGEINAVQQVSLQDEDPKDIETIIEGIENLQKVRSEYIIKFYGAEVLHNKLYMFMEYCNEGTLWMIAQLGLTEQMIRHYTRDILKAVDAIHTSNIVHRDIKGTNIFLSSNGSIKLGDFGQSVQLQNFKNTNEMQQAGTIPYMSPEIILKGKMGKPMDIWAVGCVVIEMATGKLPWSEYKEPFAIMYRLGSGERPSIPRAALSQEGHRFLDKCLMFDVDKRPTAIDLFNDPFVKVND